MARSLMARSFQRLACGFLALSLLASMVSRATAQAVAGPPVAAQPQRPLQQPVQQQPLQQQPLPAAGPGFPQPAAAPPAGPQAPAWYPLPPDHDKYLNDVLNYWEKSSARVVRYRCKFKRWNYDPTFTQRDAKTGELPAKSVSGGDIMYASPDKGLFREEKVEHYSLPRAAGEQGKWETVAGEKGDHWVCDGKSIFVFDYPNKKLFQTELPPEMQGKAIVDGPLPFLFGAEASKVKDRFWVRVITPSDVKGEYWLEAHPKRREDAANFKMIKIIIDILTVGNEKYSLPKAMAIYDRSPSFQSFSFENREVNWSTLTEKITNPFTKEFYEPSTPPGFKKVVERYQPGGSAQRVANSERNLGGSGPQMMNGANGPNARPNGNPNGAANSTLYYNKNEPAKR